MRPAKTGTARGSPPGRGRLPSRGWPHRAKNDAHRLGFGLARSALRGMRPRKALRQWKAPRLSPKARPFARRVGGGPRSRPFGVGHPGPAAAVAVTQGARAARRRPLRRSAQALSGRLGRQRVAHAIQGSFGFSFCRSKLDVGATRRTGQRTARQAGFVRGVGGRGSCPSFVVGCRSRQAVSDRRK